MHCGGFDLMEKIAIIGGGPAGTAAAIQLSRSGFDVTVFEKQAIGGLAVNANLIENYLGFPSGISGIRFTGLLEKHLENLEIEVKYQEIDTVKFENNTFLLNNRPEKYSRLIIATGTKQNQLNISGMDKIPEDKIHYEVYELLGESNKTIGIIGAGDAAFDYALNLSLTNKSIILNRGEEIKALDLLRDRAEKNTNIEYRNNVSVNEIISQKDKLLLNCKVRNEKNEDSFFEILLDYLLIAIGRQAATPMLSNEMELVKDDLIKQKRLFFIGDLINDKFRQVSLSAADGIRAAMEIKFDWDEQSK
jgi:thioredoxin reductase (NADPH)